MTQENTLPEAHSVSDLDTFFTLLNAWHTSKVAMLNHMKDVPEGTEVSVGGDDGPPTILSGEMLAGFQLGIDLSLMELGILPFYPEPEDAQPA